MRQYGLLILAGCSLVAGGVCAYFAGTARPQGLECLEPVQDLGELRQADKGHATFRLRNRYDQSLKILGVKSDCGCSDIVIAEKELAPSAETTVSAVWHTGERRGKTGVKLMAVYELADKRQSFRELAICGDVRPEIEYAPNEVTFAEKSPGERTVKLTPGKAEAFSVPRVYCSHRSLTAEWRPASSEVAVTYDRRSGIRWASRTCATSSWRPTTRRCRPYASR